MKKIYPSTLRQALVRLLSDLVKSDEVISVSELDNLDKCFKEFGINRGDRQNAAGITLQEAFLYISQQSGEIKNEVLDAMKSIAGADSEICRAEALLIVAMQMLIRGSGVRVYSMKFKSRPILNTQILYLDASAAPRLSGDIFESVYEEASRIVESAGFELVYIPKIKERLNEWDKEPSGLKSKQTNNLSRVFSLIAPCLDDDELSILVKRSQGLSMKTFYKEVLCSPDGLDMPLDIINPSYLIRLCNSNVNGIGYANFLCMELDIDRNADRTERNLILRRQLHRFVEDLNNLQGVYTITVNKRKKLGEDFQYGGFYKVLFDVLSAKKKEAWTLNIYRRDYADIKSSDNRKCQLTFTNDGMRKGIPLTGMDAALYVLAICMTHIEGGLNVRKEKLLKELFEKVYWFIKPQSRDDSSIDTPDITKPVTLRQVKFRISKAFSAASLSETYGLHLSKKGAFLTVDTDFSHIFVKDFTDTPLLGTSLYREIKRIVSE